eukprot:gb/GFBE01004814.1/.p1 GENE.gb/GFBE01004814.1/~~gb/GFBE01004814.1/.p1  ORF type:complete len:337 (+),score=65.89 gb/GFBE01004814.1/:1-1011(+)
MEKRVDPSDGAAYTWKELSSFYAKQYSKQEIQEYWDSTCRPLRGKGGARAKASAAPAVLEPPVLAERSRWAKVSFCPDPKTQGFAFTRIYDDARTDSVHRASVNAGNGERLKVGGGTINFQFAKELGDAAGHDARSYLPFHEALFRFGTKPAPSPGLVEATPELRMPTCLAGSFLYLGGTADEAAQVAEDPGRAGIVILDVFEERHRPYHERNVGMVYTVGPERSTEIDDASFLQKVRLVGKNVVAACREYNLLQRAALPPFERVRLCLVSGGKYAGRVPKDLVAKQLVTGVLDGQPSSGHSAELDATPEIEFAYDDDVLRIAWEEIAASVDVTEK